MRMGVLSFATGKPTYSYGTVYSQHEFIFHSYEGCLLRSASTYFERKYGKLTRMLSARFGSIEEDL